jgi:hypothetical protein
VGCAAGKVAQNAYRDEQLDRLAIPNSLDYERRGFAPALRDHHDRLAHAKLHATPGDQR